MRHFRILLPLLLLVTLTATAQMHGYNTNFDLSQKDFCDTIPIEIEDDQIYIEAEMEGRTLRFNLDTGSSQGMLFKGAPINYWTELGKVVSHDANNRQDTVKVIALPPFRIGRLVVSNYVASVLPRPLVKGKYDAILGFDIFNKGLCAKIDAERKILILTDRRNLFDEEPGFAVKYKLKWFVPYVLTSPFIRHVDEALFDLGSRPLYTMNKASFDAHAYKSKQVNAQVEGRQQGNLVIGNYGTENKDEVAFLHLDRLKWDKFSFTNVRTITTQGSSRIGARILRYGNIIINPFRRQIIFQPKNDADSVEVGNKQMGVAFVPVDDRAVVGLIWEGSEAYQKGMRQGDVILAINGKAIRSFGEFVHYPFVEGQKYRFTLRDEKGFNKEVTTER
jgi:hypothetical protein